jgi:hypothetical protein
MLNKKTGTQLMIEEVLKLQIVNLRQSLINN